MYGQFQNPYTYPAMQNRLNPMDQQYRQQMPLSGRVVTGMEEARASQIALDGTPSYFPSPAENKIYVKSLDMSGLPIFLTYELKMQNYGNQNPKSEENIQISNLVCRIDAIENKLKEMTNYEPNAVNPNA